MSYLETVGDFAPAAVFMGTVFFCFAAVATAVDDERLGVVVGHIERDTHTQRERESERGGRVW